MVFALATVILASASAQEESYRAEISPADRVNSRGVALKTLREFLRQDRFNVHGGHHIDPGDTVDSRFGTVEARGRIDGARLVTSPGLEGDVVEGRVSRLEVVVSGADRSLLLRVAPAPAEDKPGVMTKSDPPTPPAGTKPATPAAAEFEFAYTTTLGERDLVDTNGSPLWRLRDILAQDRSNVHLLGKADPGDEVDSRFASARARRGFASGELHLDPSLVPSLLERRQTPVKVYVGPKGRFRVTAPAAGLEAAAKTIESLVEERHWTVNAMGASGAAGTEAAMRDLVRLSDLAHGRGHETSVLHRAGLANLLMEVEQVEKVAPLLAEIEEGFREAAAQGVSEDAVFAVMAFLVQGFVATGDLEAAGRLLEELLEPPGREKWKLGEEARSALEKMRADLGMARPSYEEGLAALERAESDPGFSAADRLSLLVEVIFLHPRRRGEDYERLHQRLAERVSEVAGGESDAETRMPLADARMTLAFREFRNGAFAEARKRCEVVLSELDAAAFEEQMPAIHARELLVRIASAEGRTDEAEDLARSHLEWAGGKFESYDDRLLSLASRYLELLADRGDAAGIEKVSRPYADAALSAEHSPDPSLRVVWHELVADFLFTAGAAERADAWYRELTDLAGENPDLHPVFASAYSQWGHLYESDGRYERAEAIWSEGLARVETMPDRIADQVSMLQDLSLVRKHYRDEPGAIELIERGRRLAAEQLGTDSISYAVASNNLVLPLNALGRREEAIAMAKEALRVAASHPDREWAEESERIFRNNEAILLMNSNPEAAAEVYAEIVSGMERAGLGEDHDLALFLMNLGAAQRETRRSDEAEKSFLRALEILREQGWKDRRNLSIVLDALAALALRKGQVAGALEHSRESIRLADEFLANASALASESEKLALGSLFDHGARLHVLIAAGEIEEACQLSLRTKGTVLDQSIRDARTLRLIAEDEEARKRFADLRAKQRQLNRIALASQHGGGGEDESLPALAHLQQEVKRLQASLLSEGDRVGEEALAVDLDLVRSRLGEGDRYYEFIQAVDETGEFYLGAFEIGSESLRWVRLATLEMARLSVTGFREAVDRFMNARSAADLAEASGRLEAASRRLSGLFLAPLELPEKEGARVVLCPEGLLHFVPFAVLLDAQNRFAGEHRVFDYVASARDFCRESGGGTRDLSSAVVVGGPNYALPHEGADSEERPETAVLLAERRREERGALSGIARSGGISLAPLPGAEKEAGLIAETLAAAGTNVALFTAAEATERAVADAVGPGIVHVATHGVFFDLHDTSLMGGAYRSGTDPMLRGALALTGAQSSVGSWRRAEFPDADNDGWLFAAEAVQLDLRGTELVTLSACETGVGGLATGEGVIGLRRAFLAAGARHVLSTLWPISDEMTVELMRDFYERIGEGKAVTDAFAGAQGEALRVFRSENARAEAIVLFGAFVMNRAGN